MASQWTIEEDNFLTNYYSKKKAEWLAKKLNRSPQAVYCRASTLGVKRYKKGDGMDYMKQLKLLTALKPPRDEPKDDPKETQVGGDHYKMAMQPIDFISANSLNFSEGSVIKYICRHRKKNGKEDLLKAKHYIDLLIQAEYGE